MVTSCPRRAAAAPEIELPPFWEESKREVAPLSSPHTHLCGVWASWRNGPPFPGSAGTREVHGRKTEEMYPLSIPHSHCSQEATCSGGRAWGLPAQQACGSCSKPLGRGLTSSQLCETPGGFLTSSNGRVGVGWGRHRPRCQLLPAQAQALCCLPPAPLLHPHPHPLTVRKIQHL